MSDYTPGPWSFHHGADNVKRDLTDPDLCILGSVMGGGFHIARVWSDAGESAESAEANARLIAAAPDLLYALTNLYALVKGECPSITEVCDLTQKALAKANGTKA